MRRVAGDHWRPRRRLSRVGQRVLRERRQSRGIERANMTYEIAPDLSHWELSAESRNPCIKLPSALGHSLRDEIADALDQPSRALAPS